MSNSNLTDRQTGTTVRAGSDVRGERIDPDASAGTIEKQIDAKRADINRTLSALEERFSPGQMVDQTLGLVRDNGGEVVQNLGRSFRDNPMPFVLTGVGLIWAMASSGPGGGSSIGRYRSRYYGRGQDDGYAGRDIDERSLAYRDSAYTGRDTYQRDAFAGVARGSVGVSGGSDLQPRYSDGSYASTTGSFASAWDDEEEDKDDGKSFVQKMRERAEAMGEKVSDATDSLSEEVSGMSEEAANRYREAKAEAAWRRERAKDRARHHRERAGVEMENARRRAFELGEEGRRRAYSAAGSASDFVQEQPMLAGALGAAVGALIGALLPTSEVEDRYLGEHADTAKREAQAKAETGMGRLREEAESGMERVRSEAEGGLAQAREKVESAAAEARGRVEKGLSEADRKAREDEKSGPVPGADTRGTTTTS